MKTCDVCRTEWSETLDNGRCPRCEREQLRRQIASAEERVHNLEVENATLRNRCQEHADELKRCFRREQELLNAAASRAAGEEDDREKRDG